MAFSRGKYIMDWYLFMKFNDKYRFAFLQKNEKYYWENSRKYIVKFIQDGNIPYIVFGSSSKNDMFVRQEYPQYNFLCQYQGFDIYKFKQNKIDD